LRSKVNPTGSCFAFEVAIPLRSRPVLKLAVTLSLSLSLKTASANPKWFILNLPVRSELKVCLRPILASNYFFYQSRPNSEPIVCITDALWKK
jgi:hypothetical protein